MNNKLNEDMMTDSLRGSPKATKNIQLKKGEVFQKNYLQPLEKFNLKLKSEAADYILII